MSVLDLQELPLSEHDGEQTVLPGNDALAIPSGVSLLLCNGNESNVSLLGCL
jgi:hypothetical protein